MELENLNNYLKGIPILENPLIPEYKEYYDQFRFPKSKSKRIQKKWAKNQSNYVSKKNLVIYHFIDKIYANPETVKILKMSIS